MGLSLTTSKVFASMTVFDILRNSIALIAQWLNKLMNGKVSLDRIDGFLKKTELLDAFDEKEVPVLFSAGLEDEEKIGFRNATFSWSKQPDGSLTRSRQFMLKIDGEVLFKRSRINLVVGPTGSGKSSLLMALLGEMHWIPASPDSWYNLPRESGIAYAAQESWVLNETIRDNIIFDTPFDEERYKKVLYQCAVEPHLALFQAGDQTEVGEKGLTLSGGQKARLTLARAIYSKAAILLLDDVLAALDVHTAQWIIDRCFGGDLVENRTIILVTHNVTLARPIADFIVRLGSDGRLAPTAKYGSLSTQIPKEEQIQDKSDQKLDTAAHITKPADGKLILAEEMQLGHVSASAVKMYLLSLSANHPVFFFTFLFGGLLFNQSSNALMTWMLGYWASQYEDRSVEDVNPIVAIALTCCTSLAVMFTFLLLGQLRASNVIHYTLIDSVLLTNDIRAVDDSLPYLIWPLATLTTSMLVRFAAVVFYTPIFFFPGALAAAIGACIGQIYIAGQLPVKRFMSNARAPVLSQSSIGHCQLTTYPVSIRAFGAQSKFTIESIAKIDRYTRAARNYYNLNRLECWHVGSSS
ncbi:P-loop containing nucleoside triphosphate hydrolase protein [Mycena maculata]|uniref:P-loop containing nucleoside triphosphate hydrolase protein n=1 Tax=Mycena maculata TaxID=230809 RepID=A0AAD7NN17_9AGAR|nr:P-loop containing nucleoside triphosphate hydrolase protein [Mycena maculata]